MVTLPGHMASQQDLPKPTYVPLSKAGKVRGDFANGDAFVNGQGKM